MDYSRIINEFRNRRILVVGDLILDHYIWGKVRRISPEAPVPVVEVTRESFMLGGAANVAYNIVAMGGKASVIGIGGRDMAGKTLVDMLTEKGVDCSGIFAENRPTTVKTRVIAHNQQVVRFDREDSKYVGGTILRGVTEHIKAVIGSHDAVIVSDYKKGMVSRDLIRGILRNSKYGKSGERAGMFVAVDPKIGHFDLYKGVSLITPNIMEASSGSHTDIHDDKTLLRAGRALMRKLGCAAVLITRGEQGMSLFERSA